MQIWLKVAEEKRQTNELVRIFFKQGEPVDGKIISIEGDVGQLQRERDSGIEYFSFEGIERIVPLRKEESSVKKFLPEDGPQAHRPYFTEVCFQNILCFGKEQTLNLTTSDGQPSFWIVILGNNNLGKTVLLQSISALSPNLDLYFLKNQGLFSNLSQGLQKDSSSSNKNLSSSQISAKVCYRKSSTDSEEEPVVTEVVLKAEQKRENLTLERQDQFTNLICYGYGASRRNKELSLAPASNNVWGDISKNVSLSLFSGEYPLPNAEEWLLETYFAFKDENSTAAKNNLERVKGLLIETLPEVDDIKIQQRKVLFSTPFGDLPLEALSVGYKTTTAWMVDLARRLHERYPESPNPLAEPAIVLVDEIDLHLHPIWQRKLVRHLRKTFSQTQFIVTSHSPLIVQAEMDAKIILLKREGNQVVIENNPSMISGWRIDQVLTGVMGLDGSRPPELEELINQRDEILAKSVLSEDDNKLLEELKQKIGNLPLGDTAREMEAMDIILQAADELKQKEKLS